MLKLSCCHNSILYLLACAAKFHGYTACMQISGWVLSFVLDDMCFSWANSPYFILALPIVAMFGITALAFETLIPSENEIKVVHPWCVLIVFTRCRYVADFN